LPPGVPLEGWEGLGWALEGVRGVEAGRERDAIVSRAPEMASFRALIASSEAEGKRRRGRWEGRGRRGVGGRGPRR